MAEQIENVPGFVTLSPERLEEIRAQLGVDNLNPETTESQPPQRRRRGRPRKYERDEFNRPIKDRPVEPGSITEDRPLETLASPPLTSRDSKETAARIQNLLQGASQLGAVFNPHILMTDKEAENIAKPFTSYILRTEATSAVARRVINDYDVAAFVIATLAYMVRVVKDIQSERAANSDQSIAERRSPRGIPERVPTSQRAIEPEVADVVPETNGENANGQEGTIDLFGAANATILQSPPGNV